jgi:hypothetical protein
MIGEGCKLEEEDEGFGIECDAERRMASLGEEFEAWSLRGECREGSPCCMAMKIRKRTEL